MIGSSLGAALGIAEQLPDDAAAQLTELARQSFVDGHAAATIDGGCILILAAVACPLLIHRGKENTVGADGEAR